MFIEVTKYTHELNGEKCLINIDYIEEIDRTIITINDDGVVKTGRELTVLWMKDDRTLYITDSYSSIRERLNTL